MIPKIIHYCWFGRGEKPAMVNKCIESWKKHCPDYKIIEWNEDNFDVYQNPYTKYCYDNKKYAFLSDYVRLLVVYREGGIYYDTDVELIKPIDSLLNNKAFVGFEINEFVNTGIGFGAEKNNSAIKLMINEYDKLLDGENGTVGCPILNTEAIKKIGLKLNGETQYLGEITVYSSDYFNPYVAPTGVLSKTCNTYSIHWFSASWMSKGKRLRCAVMKPIHRLLSREK